MSGSGGDLDNTVGVEADQSDGYAPDPSAAVTDAAKLLVDASQRLEAHSSVTTDELSFRDDFTGSALTDEWTPTVVNGGSVTVTASTVNLVTSNGNNRSAAIFREADYLPYNLSAAFTISQRIANQTTLFGFRDDTGTTEKQALFEFTGTSNTVATCRSSSSSQVADTQTTSVTLPQGNTSTSHIYRIDVSATYVAFSIDGVVVALHQTHIPGPYDVLGVLASISNATGSPNSTTVSIDWVTLLNVNQVEVTNGFTAESTRVTPAAYPATYSAAMTSVSPAASATDIFTLTGSATKLVKIKSIKLDATQTASGTINVSLVKRSTANTGGTSATLTAVPHDSSSVAATAVARSYTANPTLGTTVGSVRADKMYVPAAATESGDLVYDFGDIRNSQPIVLRTATEVLSVNLNATTVAGGSFSGSIEWTEE